ncbi:hypothetical protein CHU94_06220 [Rhodoferax sp. TH121]|uniref:GmrSD restriction endonuclease domain-containing protein n=1 Tax=Rhodoferax sp. TH121 TaxID=2022803 RepID=UPI000B970D6D|nr:DUF262 domain-containing protein [Rhodoferax sp. TH121]OYQ40738.1 hypothetical protein CHU94_06220 [Rhodoferax sp. TH121]
MIKYQIRSKELLDLVNEYRNRRLIISPYFQRDLVWRELHKVDFIKTILSGYPFPQIFISRGKIDVESMTATSCVVDGQQRLNSIIEYVGDVFPVDGKRFSELESSAKEDFLKYQVPIIDLDLIESDPQIKELFKRLNRTFYSLSKIERLATEYSPSEYMLVAKLLANQLSLSDEELEPMMRDPNVPPAIYEWAANQKVSSFQKWLTTTGLFTDYELSRKVHLMFTLNLMSSTMSGFFNRNELSEEYLNQYSQEFPDKNVVLKNLEETAKYLLKLKLKENSYWMNKANAFSLFVAVFESRKVAEVDAKKLKAALELFEKQVPQDYSLAAKEAVNNKRERVLRHGAIQALIADIQGQPST